MCGIISDTLNLRSPTTTLADREAYNSLANIAGFRSQIHIDEFSFDLFKAKSDTSGLSAKDIIELDFKRYEVFKVVYIL